jgi:adenylate cyclase
MNENSPTPATTVSDVFVSYASLDTAVANAIVEALEKHGITCWIAPRDVTPGEFYADAIVGAINASRVLVVVLTHNAVTSTHVLREVERASAKRHPVVSLRIDAAPLPTGLEYFLSASHWLDATGTGLEAVLPKLADAVRHLVASTPGADPSQIRDPARRPADLLPQPPVHAKASRRMGRMFVATMVMIALAATYLIAERLRISKPVTPLALPVVAAVQEKSIAVLPFVDMSEKHDQEYFSDGLSEELIDHLAHIPDLKVIARTSSFAFKGKNEDMRSIATKLGVANLLEGSVRKSGGELRITVQLISALDGVHLWSETYDRKLTDIFKVQEEISTTVARALNAALNMTNASAEKLAAKGTTNISAYNLLLQANYFFWRGDKGDNAKAVEHLLQALKLDPHYAPAWSKLARVYAWQGFIGELTGAEGARLGRAAVERALALDPNCAEAYYARANISRLIDGDLMGSVADNEKAAALDAHGEVGLNARANILNVQATVRGRFDDAIAFARQRLERDPLDTETMSDLALFEQWAGRFEESAAVSRRLLDQNPDFVTANAQYAVTLLMMGKSSAALAAVEKETDDASKFQALGCVYWALGRRSESDAALAALERVFADRKAYEIATVHACRGEADAAFAWLDRAYRQVKGSIVIFRVDPLLLKLRADPRFEALLRKVKLVE